MAAEPIIIVKEGSLTIEVQIRGGSCGPCVADVTNPRRVTLSWKDCDYQDDPTRKYKETGHSSRQADIGR